MIKKIFVVSLLVYILFIKISDKVLAQGVVYLETISGKVVSIIEQGNENSEGYSSSYQKLKLKVYKGSLHGTEIEVLNSSTGGEVSIINYQNYKIGDKLNVAVFADEEGNQQYALDGLVKSDGIFFLVVLFIVVVLVVGRIWGALSLAGLVISFLVIFKLIVPMIIGGYNPIFAAVLGSLLIVPTTFYISHGFNIKTHVGVIATFFGLVITGLLAVYFVDAVHLTGYASEEAGFLQIERSGSVDIRGILLAGIIIGTLGILDDVTVGQSSTVRQLQKANPKMSVIELFQHGMSVGQDHISSMVNTLVLVYSGSALPLLLLFFGSEKGFLEILEYELIAEEIVRMLVGSIGLVLSAPLATIMAAYLFSNQKRNSLVDIKKMLRAKKKL